VDAYLLWPCLQEIGDVDPETPVPGFHLWRYGADRRCWIKDDDFGSGVVYVRPAWLGGGSRVFSQGNWSRLAEAMPHPLLPQSTLAGLVRFHPSLLLKRFVAAGLRGELISRSWGK